MNLIKKILMLFILNGLLLAAVPREFISARSYGLGHSFVAQKFDPASTLYNPAGIAGIEHLKLFATQTTLVDDVSYTGFSVAKPFNKKVLGLSVINRSVNDIPLSSEVPDDYNIDFDNKEKMSFHSGVMAINYASILGEVSYGLNFKKFFASTVGYSNGNAGGYNLDLGFLYQIHAEWSVGLSLRDILKSKIVWDTTEAEQMSMAWIFGVKTTALKRNTSVLVDLKSNYFSQKAPLFSVGMEWHPVDSLFFRFGLDQKMLVPDFNKDDTKYYFNYSTGIGINIAGFRFDYAYQLDQEILNFSKHVFSLSYVGDESVDKMVPVSINLDVAETVVISFNVQQPLDKTVTTSGQILVIVKVENDKSIWINHEKYSEQDNGLIKKVIPLHVGLNDIIISHEQASQIKLKVLRIATFSDIQDSLYKLSIEQFATIGFIKEDFLDKFNPKRPLTRQEVSAIVTDVENIGIPPTLKGIWQDIDLLFNKGLIKGYPGGDLLPNKKITRAEIAMILARLLEFDERQQSFDDQHWAFGAASYLASTGLFSMSEFIPWNGFVTKEETAELFTRLPQVEQKINSLMNFQEIDYDQKQVPALLIRQQDDQEYQIFQNLLMKNDLESKTNLENNLEITIPATVSTLKVSENREKIIIYEPSDKSIVYTDNITVRGLARDVRAIIINGQAVNPDADGNFQTNIKLTKLKNIISVKIVDVDGAKTYQKRVLKLQRIKDLSTSHPAFKNLAAMVALGYLKIDENFYPDKPLTRAQYAKMIADCYQLNIPVVVKAPFKDVAVSHPQVGAISAVSVRGYIEGSNQFFRPNDLVSRAFGAVVIARAEKLKEQKFSAYTDLSSGHWAAGSIAALIKKDIIKPEKKFYPSENLKRLTAAIWLSRTVQQEIDNLYSFN